MMQKLALLDSTLLWRGIPASFDDETESLDDWERELEMLGAVQMEPVQ